MSKTVVIVSNDGRLIDVAGTLKESGANYSKFAKRLLGDSRSTATLDYGWNGKTGLVISKGGEKGARITLSAQEVVVTDSLSVGGQPLGTIIANDVDLAIDGIYGTEGEISVSTFDNPDYPGEGQPRKTCMISLDESMVNRIETMEQTLEDLIVFDMAYKIGDGLTSQATGAYRTAFVKTGLGIKFVDDESDPESTKAIAADCDEYPSPASEKPVSSKGVYEAISDATEFRIEVSDETGNVVLYDMRS